ncbi:MAG: hypothetical protein OXC72_15540 [Roseovarius sp.]|nr:hypothetical protein [Roseovarius sp.]
MSKTDSLAMLTVIIILASESPAFAQNKMPGSFELPQLSGNGSVQGASALVEIRDQIEEQIIAILSRRDNGIRHRNALLTIEDIDKVNRTVERERVDLELAKTRFERSQLEMQKLLAFYETAMAIEVEEREGKSSISKNPDSVQVAFDGENPDKPEIMDSRRKLPRIMSITGTGGIFSAEAVFDGKSVATLQTGMLTLNNYQVEAIERDHVSLRDLSSSGLFRVMPESPKSRQFDSPAGHGGVIDLGRYPMVQF